MSELLAKEITKTPDKIKDFPNESVIKEDHELKDIPPAFESSIDSIENQSLQSLKVQNQIASENADPDQIKQPLTDEQKEKIKEETGWSDEIIDAMSSWEEYEIYKNAGLQEMEINGRKCLVKSDIDWDQKDEFGRTNKERVEGEPPLSPIDKNGETIELHHIGQKADGPFAELTRKEHMQEGNNKILHDTSKRESEIDHQGEFKKEKQEHWSERANS